MQWLKRLSRTRAVREMLGFGSARYLGLVRRTNRCVMEPANAYDRIGPMMPVIAAMWHGQHFMIHFAKRPQDRAASLVSRSGDGELNAIALRHLGVRAIRGSGARGRDVREKGGVAATREMLRALANGEMVVLTADVPKIARVCGEGIVTLAKLSGRPIVPVAVVTSRRFVLRNWDRASLRPALRPRRDGARRAGFRRRRCRRARRRGGAPRRRARARPRACARLRARRHDATPARR